MSEAEPQDEILEVVDGQGCVLELRTRGEIHRDPSLAHRAVHVLVRNGQGDLYLQQRSMDKLVQPGKWDASVGGHVDPGESYEAAAEREMEEELGLRLSDLGQDLGRLHDYVWSGVMETEHVRTFEITWEGPFVLNPVEIDAGRFWTVEELQGAAGTGVLTPMLEHELRLDGALD